MSFSPITGSTETTMHTSAEGLRQGMIDMPTYDGTIPAYHAVRADAANPPVILVIQEIFGLHEHVRDVCRRFAHEGYFAIAVELYQRQGDAGAYTDTARLIKEIVAKVPDEQVLSDLDASARWAGEQGGDTGRLGVTGFCWGGRLVWMYAAHTPQVKAGVAWYGRLSSGHGPLIKRNPVDVAHSLHAPVLGLYGGLDASIPLEDVERMRHLLAQGNDASRASEIIVYPKANHAFFADYRPSYRQEDATEAWARTLAWFGRYLA